MQRDNAIDKTHLTDVEASLINDIDFFDSLSEEELDEISCLFIRSEWTSGSTIFHQGDQGTSVHFVTKGRVKLCKFSDEGNELIFGIIQPGEYFGELAFLGASERLGYAITLEKCNILSINRHDWIQVMTEKPNAALHMLQILSLRLRQTTRFLEDITFYNGPSRLALRFLILADFSGKRTKIGISIDIPLSTATW